MLEELKGIDIAAVGELRRLKDEGDVLRGRLTAMEAKRGSVSDEVFSRVSDDYQGRLADLDERARPLKEAAQRELAKLRDLLARLDGQARGATLAREELEFRRSLGEFTEEEHGRRRAAVEETVAGSEADLGEARELEARFLDVLDAARETDLDQAAAPAEQERSSPSLPELATAPDESDHAIPPPAGSEAIALETAEPDGEAPTPAGDSAVATGVTRPMPSAQAASEQTSAAEEPGAHEPMATTALEVARLMGRGPDGGAEEYALQLGTTTIGRSPKNDICLRDASVSRQHAKIVFTERGFVIYDLGSENGVYVNAERITHRLLFEGDEIEFGPGLQPFVFRAP
jgi:FHA domain